MDVLCADTISGIFGRGKRSLGQFIGRKGDGAGHCVSLVPKPESQLMAPALIDGDEPQPLLPLSPLIRANLQHFHALNVSSPCLWTQCPLHPSHHFSNGRSPVPATPQLPLASAIIWVPSSGNPSSGALRKTLTSPFQRGLQNTPSPPPLTSVRAAQEDLAECKPMPCRALLWGALEGTGEEKREEKWAVIGICKKKKNVLWC